jgi:riboflavin synthase
MFTGLIQDVGRVRTVRPHGDAVHLEIETRLAQELVEGDSLAVNGVCLTVTTPGEHVAVATAIPETMSRTNLGDLAPGSAVNLEPALRVGDRLGGHIVQGHVDGVGRVVAIEPRGISREWAVEAEPEILRYVVEKGSIAVSGISLTVAAVAASTFTVALIPHTMAATTLHHGRVGDRVNLEVDILAKYVERMLSGRGGEGAYGLSEEYLRRHGFA